MSKRFLTLLLNAETMILFPNAKINIGLHVTQKRPDGYHNLETVFYPIDLCDTLEILSNDASDELVFTTSGLEIDGDSNQNLIVKAYNALSKIKKLGGVRIHLHKIIPFGAGLGGGSADAAFCLKGLNEFFELNLTNADLKKIAAGLGADCAFFIDNVPSFATGIGDILEPVELDLSAFCVVLVKPNVSVGTSGAYAKIIPEPTTYSLKNYIHYPVKVWHKQIANDFETSVFLDAPEIQKVKFKLLKMGAQFALMSGSGASVYAIFENDVDLTNQFPESYYIWKSKQ